MKKRKNIKNIKHILKEVKIGTAEKLFKELSVTGKYNFLFNGKWVFRGQSDSRYKLIPSAFRKNSEKYFFNLSEQKFTLKNYLDTRILGEWGLLCDFYDRADYNGLDIPFNKTLQYRKNEYFANRKEIEESFEKWISDDFKEITALAQHYELPTRLLDWTYDLYIALYFSISEYLKENEIEIKDKYICLWTFNIETILRINDEISHNFFEKIKERNEIREQYNKEVKEKGISSINSLYFYEGDYRNILKGVYELNTYNKIIYEYNKKIEEYNKEITKYNKNHKNKLSHKEYLKYEIPIKILKPPYYNNDNLKAQKGILAYHEVGKNKNDILNLKILQETFTLGELQDKELSMEEIVLSYLRAGMFGKQCIFYKFIIPAKEFVQIYLYLDKLRYNASKLFPGYYGVSRHQKEDTLIKNIMEKLNNTDSE